MSRFALVTLLTLGALPALAPSLSAQTCRSCEQADTPPAAQALPPANRGLLPPTQTHGLGRRTLLAMVCAFADEPAHISITPQALAGELARLRAFLRAQSGGALELEVQVVPQVIVLPGTGPSYGITKEMLAGPEGSTNQAWAQIRSDIDQRARALGYDPGLVSSPATRSPTRGERSVSCNA